MYSILRVDFRTILPFERHQSCNIRFTTNGKIRGSAFNVEFTEDQSNMDDEGSVTLQLSHFGPMQKKLSSFGGFPL